MGRARRNASNSQVTTASPTGSRNGMGATGAHNQLQTALGSINAALPLNAEFDGYLDAVNDAAARQIIGANGRLYVAAQDLIDAQRLANSPNPHDQALAQTMTDNSLWYLGRGMALYGTPDAPYLQDLRAALRAYGQERGPAQIDYLKARGFLPEDIPAEQIAAWRENAGALYEEAFSTPRNITSTKGSRPVWNAIQILDRVAKAKESILRSPTPAPGSDLERMRERALKDCDQAVRESHRYLTDLDGKKKTYDYVSPEGPSKATRIEAVAAALNDPRALALNRRLDASGMVDRHRRIATEATGGKANSFVGAFSDSRWLNQMVTYGRACNPADVAALNVSGIGIFMSPNTAEETLQAGPNAVDEALLHELLHTTQPEKPSGHTLKDAAHPQAFTRIPKRHAQFEVELLEAGTQAYTVHLRETNDPRTDGQPGKYYPTLTILAQEAQRASGLPADQFYRELNATPTNQRTAYLARSIAGSDDERTVRDTFEPLLNITMQGEHAAQQSGGYTANILERYRSFTRDVFAELAGRRAPLAAVAA